MHRYLIRTFRQTCQLLGNIPFTTIPNLRYIGIIVLEVTITIFRECPSVIAFRKARIRHHPCHIIRLPVSQSSHNTGFQKTIGTRLDTIKFIRVKCTAISCFLQFSQIIFIIVEHHTFLRIDRILQFCIQLIDLSIQILISLHIQNQTIHTK